MTVLLKKYSSAQKEAIQLFDRELCVSAGAGSGKTSVLVERFLYAVTERKVEPERILAITFTEKAAGEMKSRLVEECRKRGLKEFRHKLESAYISTIHSFCSRILKENPVESGVDPFFRVLNSGEAQILMDQVIERIFEEGSENTRLVELLSQFGEEATRRSIKKFYEMNRARGDDAGIFECHDFTRLQKKMASETIREAQHLDRSIDPGEATEAQMKLKNGIRLAIELMQAKEAPGWDRIDKAKAVKLNLPLNSARYKESAKRIHGLLEDWAALEVEKLAEPLKREFERVSIKFRSVYDEEKRSRAVYDFEDLLFLAYRLLSDPAPEKQAVRERYRSHFSCILVDEYQDTSPLQDRIIERLKEKNNLFVVGDSQQSIYGFRYADPDIFEKRILGGRHGKNVRHIRLSENYRSSEELLKFINGLFQQFSTGASFHPLEAFRPSALKTRPTVELLCVARGEGESEGLDQARVFEARSLAAHIQRIVESKTPVRETDGSARPIHYHDIAVLFRGMKRSYLYEKELTDRAIPYEVSKGGGFYEKPEILDFINCLRLIENPHSDIALAGVLRSPLVCASDDALFWLARKAKASDRDRPLAQGLKSLDRIRELADEDRRKLRHFAVFLEELRIQKNSFKISEILEKILKESAYEAKVLTRSHGKQKIANILKLINIAESVEEKNIAGIQDFIHFIEKLSDGDTSEAEAAVGGASANAVTLSTIHAAKGLEFPLVIIADMGRDRSDSKNEVFLSTPSMGLGLKLRHPKTQKFIKDYTYQKIDEELGHKESLEEERLLYVALTRAKEHLVLSGSLEIDPKTGGFKKSASWMGRVAEIIGWAPSNDHDRTILFKDVLIGAVPLQKEGVKEKTSVWSWASDPLASAAAKELRPMTNIEKARLPIAKDTALIDFEKRFAPVIKPYEETEDHSVTDLLLAANSRSESARLFLAEKDEESTVEGEALMTPRNEYGTIFHRLMEYGVLGRAKKKGASYFQSSLLQRLQASEQKEMKESVRNFWAGAWGKKVREARKCFAELPFIYKTRFGILKGQIDLVIQTRTGEWAILDYKTHRLVPADKKAVAKEYELQLLIYAFVFQKLYGDPPKKGVLYFSSINEFFEFDYTQEKLKVFDNSLNDHFKNAIEITG